jgi:hypothetical protein
MKNLFIILILIILSCKTLVTEGNPSISNDNFVPSFKKIDFLKYLNKSIEELLIEPVLNNPVRINPVRRYGGPYFESITFVFTNDIHICLYPVNPTLDVGMDSSGPLKLELIKKEKIGYIRVFINSRETAYSQAQGVIEY